MLTHNPRWSHAPGNQVVPSRWQATLMQDGLDQAYLVTTSARYQFWPMLLIENSQS